MGVKINFYGCFYYHPKAIQCIFSRKGQKCLILKSKSKKGFTWFGAFGQSQWAVDDFAGGGWAWGRGGVAVWYFVEEEPRKKKRETETNKID